MNRRLTGDQHFVMVEHAAGCWHGMLLACCSFWQWPPTCHSDGQHMSLSSSQKKIDVSHAGLRAQQCHHSRGWFNRWCWSYLQMLSSWLNSNSGRPKTEFIHANYPPSCTLAVVESDKDLCISPFQTVICIQQYDALSNPIPNGLRL